jgi:PAS domain S-box-containing protein
MRNESSSKADVDFLVGGGEMGARMRARDWSKTPLGSTEHWPQSLKTAVRIMLTSRQAMFVWWGEELINLYNDAYKAIVGGKHPQALGQPASCVWHEIWEQVGPRAESALLNNEGTYDEALLLIMERNGYPEETYYTFSYSPVPNDQGEISGIICANTDDTQRIISERQLKLLRELAARTVDARTFDEACLLSVSCLESNPYDLPFAMIYLVAPDQQQIFLAGTCGIDQNHIAAPDTVDLNSDSVLPFTETLRTHKTCVVSHLDLYFSSLPTGAWQRPPHQAVTVPIAASGETGRSGILVVGLNPYRLFDDNYKGFIELVAAQIAASIANAQAYEQERKRAEALAELDQAKTVFFSNISHEFRTPLTLMLGPLQETLTNSAHLLPPNEKEQLEMVQRNGLRLLKLVNTLLDFSRIEAGRVQASYEPTDLATFTTELASVFRSAIERAGMQLLVNCPPLPAPVYVDHQMWEKIVLNLLSNAFKFTLAGQISVSLQWSDDHVVLAVQDTGIGIPAEEIPHLFERFHRVEGAQGRTFEGSGIGLSLVQELVQMHGGIVQVTSVLGEGSCFTVSVPTRSAHLPPDRLSASRSLASTAIGATPYVEEALRWLPEEEQGSSASAPFGFAQGKPFGVAQLAPSDAEGGKPLGVREQGEQDLSAVSSFSLGFLGPLPRTARILLADDNADMRDYVKRLLSQQYEVEAVADGLAALSSARQRIPDLVLTDVMMPGLDGFGLLQQLRSDCQTREVPIILLSARAGEEARVEGLEAGADDYLIKPFSARELLARVEAALKMARLRKEAMRREQELRTEAEVAKAGLENVLAGVQDQFIVLDQEWRYTFVNHRVTEVVGKQKEELLGKILWELFPELVGSEFDIQIHRAVAEQTVTRFEYFYPTWQRWFENRVYPFAEGVTIFVTDITDRKQIEEERAQRLVREQQQTQRLQKLAEVSVIINSTLSLNTRLQLITEKARDIIEAHQCVTSLTLGENWSQAIHKISLSDKYAQWRDYNEQPTGSGIYSLVCQMQRPMRMTQAELEAHQAWQGFGKEAKKHPPMRGWLAAPFTDSKGTNMGLIQLSDKYEGEFTAADEAILIQMAQIASSAIENAHLYEESQQANRVKDEFLAVLSHELRSPLNPILGWARLIQTREFEPAELKKAVATIERNAKLQIQLIEDLLDVSRILQGKLNLNMTAVNLVTIIEAAMETVHLAAEAKGIQIQTMLDASVGKVLGDSGRLQQVIWNLLSNAIKFTPEGGAVNIHLESVDTQAQITVSDTGKGISPEFLPHVFEYFRQADSTTTRRFGGLGLGLAIVRHLVELHGGTVWAESLGEGQGATFTVQLPVIKKELISTNNTNAVALDAFSPNLILTGIQILVVDDDTDTRDFYTFVLEQFGASVTAVASAHEALHALVEIKPDVMLSDIGMPDIDGYMLMRQVKALNIEQKKPLVAIALTAYAGEINEQQALKAGFQKHVSKPVEPEELVRIIANLTGRS